MITDNQCLAAIKAADKFTDENGPDHDFACMKEALEAAFQWQPIEDAPENGTWVVLIDKRDIVQYPVLARWRQKDGANATWRDQYGVEIINATHFFPLPPVG